MGARVLSGLAIAGALSGSLIALAAPTSPGSSGPAPAVTHASASATAAAARPAPMPPLVAGLDPLVHHSAGALLVSDLPDGRSAELSLEPGLQDHIASVLRQY